MPQEIDRLVDELQLEVIEQARSKYSEQIVERWMKPRGHGLLENANGHAKITGSCGDSMEIFIRSEDSKILDASFMTDGCMTTIVAASMAVELAVDKSVSAARAISQEDILEALDGLPEESHHCALLAANALRAAIDTCRSS